VIATNFKELRSDLKRILDEVEENNETVVIKRNSGKGSIIISLEEYNSMMETMHLLSSKKNADRIFESIDQIKSKKVKHKIIKTEKEYEAALERLEEIFDADQETREGHEAELLALLIEDYEEQHHQIEAPDPIVAVRIRMEELDLKQKDLIGVVGSKGIVSEVMNKKRKLTVKMIRNLSELLRITPNVLIKDYELN
jgi:HTH-type transcriptional regulator / antitoxin HigA